MPFLEIIQRTTANFAARLVRGAFEDRLTEQELAESSYAENVSRFDLTPEELQKRLRIFDCEGSVELVEERPWPVGSKRRRTKLTSVVARAFIWGLTVRASNRFRWRIYKCKLRFVSLDSDRAPIEFYALRYKVERNDEYRRPSAVLCPPITGITFLDRNIAEVCAANGTDCFIPYPDPTLLDLKRPLEKLQETHIDAVMKIRILVSFIRAQRDLSPEKIVGFGASLGGITMATAAAVEPRLRLAALFVAGGNFPENWAGSKQFYMKRYRTHRIKEERLEDVEGFKRKARETLVVDPLFFAKLADPRSLFLVMARKDIDVPFERQTELWHALGRPQHVVFRLGHLPAIFLYPIFHRELFLFMRNRLSELGIEVENGVFA